MAIPNWLTLSQLSGSGDTIITVTASTYEQLNEIREALLTVSGRTKSVSVDVEQSGHTFYVSNTSFNFPAAGGSSSFIVTTDGNWNITPYSTNGFSFVPHSGTGTTTVTVSCPMNSTSSSKTGTSSVIGRGTSAFTLTQAAKPTISVSPSVVSVPSSGGTVSVTVTSSADWSLSEGYGWLSASPVSGTSGVSTVTINVQENLATRSRRAAVNFTCNGYPATAVLNLSQVSHEYDPSVPLSFEIVSAGTIVWNSNNMDVDKVIMYSVNGEGWETMYPDWSISVEAGDYVMFKGDNATYGKDSTNWGHHFYTFSGSTAVFDVKGNIMSLVNSTNYANLTTLTSSNIRLFKGLFDSTNIIDAGNLVLPATTLTDMCYYGMFNNSTLSEAPELPATNLAYMCYQSMFQGCTNLQYPPSLPANTMADECYYGMFQGCTNLIVAPELPATNLALGCYCMMFRGCNSLTQATLPNLPVTTLATRCYAEMFSYCEGITDLSSFVLPATTLSGSHCYSGMFNHCTNLVTPPALPATTLSNNCYSSMFSYCTSLTSAPVLPATSLTFTVESGYSVFGVYSFMFQWCTSLTTPPVLPATTLSEKCYYEMFNYSGLVTAPELPATTLTDGCYYRMFGQCSALTTTPVLSAQTLTKTCYQSLFAGCPNVDRIECLATDRSAQNCTTNWVNGVKNTGTFVKSATASWTSGDNGIPYNWAIVDVL